MNENLFYLEIFYDLYDLKKIKTSKCFNYSGKQMKFFSYSNIFAMFSKYGILPQNWP